MDTSPYRYEEIDMTRRDFARLSFAGFSFIRLHKRARAATEFTYYVDTNGSDANSGKSPAKAFRTIQKVNSLMLSPGQSVGFKGGCIWRETLTITQSGSRDNAIVFGAYGGGAQPIISAADATAWVATLSSSTPGRPIWSAKLNFDPLLPSCGGLPGKRVSGFDDLCSPGDWHWDGESTLYLFSETDPSSLAEIPVRSSAVSINGASYVNFSGLTLRGGRINGVYGGTTKGCSYLSFYKCMVELNYSNGIYFQSAKDVFHDNCSVSTCVLRHNGSSGFKLNGYHNGWYVGHNEIFGNCLAYDGTAVENTFGAGACLYSASGGGGKGSVIEYNNVHSNGTPGMPNSFGAGLWSDTCTGVTFRHNTCHDNWAWGIYLEKNHESICHHNVCFDNAAAAYTANIGANVSQGSDAADCLIFNNTCYGGYWGIYTGANEWTHDTLTTHSWLNNISVGAINQNLYVDRGADNDGADGWGNVYLSNCFGPEESNFVVWMNANGGRPISTYAALNAAYGNDAQSVEKHPDFVDLAARDFQLRPGSPCLRTGKQIAGFTRSTPNVGAL